MSKIEAKNGSITFQVSDDKWFGMPVVSASFTGINLEELPLHDPQWVDITCHDSSIKEYINVFMPVRATISQEMTLDELLPNGYRVVSNGLNPNTYQIDRQSASGPDLITTVPLAAVQIGEHVALDSFRDDGKQYYDEQGHKYYKPDARTFRLLKQGPFQQVWRRVA